MLILVAVLVFLAGYATHRGGVCAVAATYELVADRKASRHVGFLFCAACGLAVMALGSAMGWPVFAVYTGLPASSAALAGGAIVGVGAFINGRCAFGTIADLGSGMLSRLATLAGFIAGTALGDLAHMRLPRMVVLQTPLAALPAFATAMIAMVATAGCGLALARLRRPTARHEWSPLRAMAVIGLSNGLLLVLARSWPYTSLLMQLARGGGTDVGQHALMAETFILGAVSGGVALHRFELHIGRARDWLRALLGGAIMGAGAVLVPGGNDAMLLVGVPLALPNLIAAYVAMSGVLVVLVFWQVRARTPRRREPSTA
jgi:hypothetical protein